MKYKLRSPIVKKDTLGIFSNTDMPPDFFSLPMLNEMIGKKGDFLKEFLEIPELNNVINIRARAFASGKIDAVSKVTGKPQAANQSLVKILRNPNWYQASKEFWRQSELYRSIYGNEYIYFLTPVGMPSTFKGMFTLNPSKVDIEYKPDGLYFNDETGEGVKYYYTHNGRRTEIDKSSLIHLNDNRVSKNQMLKGTSKIESLGGALDNIRKAYAKRGVILGMPVGVLGNDMGAVDGIVVPMSPDEKERIQERFRLRGSKPIITQQKVSYQSMEISAAKMGLFEESREDTMRICDAYGVPYDVIANAKSNALSDGGKAIKESRKQMYEETVQPDVGEKIDAINNHIGSESLSWEIRADFSDHPVFSDDLKERAVSLRNLIEGLEKSLASGVITKEQYQRELQKYGIK